MVGLRAKSSPADRLLARRRTSFIRDWILVLVALGLASAAGVFNRNPVQPQSTLSAISAAAPR